MTIEQFTNVIDSCKRHAIKVGKYTVTLVGHPMIGEKGCLQFNVKITKKGRDVTPKNMNPIQVYNSPLREDPQAVLLEIMEGLVKQ